MLSYLHAAGMHAAYAALLHDAAIADFDPADPSARAVGLLEKKWTSVIRLQKKVSLSLRPPTVVSHIRRSSTSRPATPHSSQNSPPRPARPPPPPSSPDHRHATHSRRTAHPSHASHSTPHGQSSQAPARTRRSRSGTGKPARWRGHSRAIQRPSWTSTLTARAASWVSTSILYMGSPYSDLLLRPHRQIMGYVQRIHKRQDLARPRPFRLQRTIHA